MDDRRFGSGLRAARVRRGWRQVDLARASAASRGTVSRIERGQLEELSFGAIRRVARALDIRLELLPRSMGADFDRLLNARHARLAEVATRWLARFSGWTVRPEISFSIFGERGVVDLLAWHAASRSLLVLELKTEIVDIGELLGTFDRKVRLAGAIAAPLGWQPLHIGAALLIADSMTNRRRVNDHRLTLRAAFPDDGRVVARWLRQPSGALRGLTFLSDARRGSIGSGTILVRRVSLARSVLGAPTPSVPARGHAVRRGRIEPRTPGELI